MSDRCPQCNKPFSPGLNSCNWCEPGSEASAADAAQSARGWHRWVPRVAEISGRDIAFWFFCLLAWGYAPILLRLLESNLDDFGHAGYGAVFALIVYAPLSLCEIAVGIALAVGAGALALGHPKRRDAYLIALIAGIAATCYIDNYHTAMARGKIGGFTLTADVRARDAEESNAFSGDGDRSVRFVPYLHEAKGWQLKWNGQKINLCKGNGADCELVSLTAVADAPATLVAVLRMATTEGTRTRVVWLQDGGERYAERELAVFRAEDVDRGCHKVEAMARLLRPEGVFLLDDRLWFDSKTTAVLPLCSFATNDDFHTLDDETPVMLSADRRWIAFLHSNGLIRVADVARRENFHACYWLPVGQQARPAPQDPAADVPASPPRVEWQHFLAWTQDGLSFAPESGVKTLLEPPAKTPALKNREARDSVCQPPRPPQANTESGEAS